MSKDRATAVRAKDVISRCTRLASFTEEPGRITRTFLSPPMRDCHREIAAWIEPLGAEIHIDAAGNLRAFYAAQKPDAPRLLIGSHLDTVPDAGAFDGILGVVLGVALIEGLQGERLPFAIELIGFSEEEGVRFGMPFIGSRALVGSLDGQALQKIDRRGISMRGAIENFGLNPDEISKARLTGAVLGYIEFHIEQGPVLEELGLPLAAVKAIAGQSRLEFAFVGRANHAGTTPMNLRRDALAAAAEWITLVEREARVVAGLVATVGSVNAMPGATNVVAGHVHASLDVRHHDDAIRIAAVENLAKAAQQIAARRGLTVNSRSLLSQASVPMDPFLIEMIDEAIRKSRCKAYRMASGAGHDAMVVAERIPAAMIFLRTPGGISHSPEETVLVEDVEKALEAGRHLLDILASSPVAQRRNTNIA